MTEKQTGAEVVNLTTAQIEAMLSKLDSNQLSELAKNSRKAANEKAEKEKQERKEREAQVFTHPDSKFQICVRVINGELLGYSQDSKGNDLKDKPKSNWISLPEQSFTELAANLKKVVEMAREQKLS